jgi:regulator of cell morphogenesis and NO signaling
MFEPTSTLARLALDHPELEGALRLLGLDYSCAGGATLREACERAGVPLQEAQCALEQAATAGPDPMALDSRALPTPALIEELVARHHAYVRSALPLVVPLASKVAQVHGDGYLIELAAGVRLLGLQLPALLALQETLFARLAEGAEGAAAQLAGSREAFGKVLELLSRLRKVAQAYAPPPDACRSQRALYAELDALEADVRRYAHHTLNVLYPRLA